MKKSLLISIIAILISGVSIGLILLKKTEKIGYINTNELMTNYIGMQEVRTQFEQKAKKWEANVDTLMQELKLEIQRYEQESATMPKKEQELARQLIQTQQVQLENYQAAVKQNAEKEELALTTNVLQEMNSFITEYGKAHNYELILGTMNGGYIIFAKESLDITEEILSKLNEQYQDN